MMLRKVLCLIGWHRWEWTPQNIEGHININDIEEIPDDAVCFYCGVGYA